MPSTTSQPARLLLSHYLLILSHFLFLCVYPKLVSWKGSLPFLYVKLTRYDYRGFAPTTNQIIQQLPKLFKRGIRQINTFDNLLLEPTSTLKIPFIFPFIHLNQFQATTNACCNMIKVGIGPFTYIAQQFVLIRVASCFANSNHTRIIPVALFNENCFQGYPVRDQKYQEVVHTIWQIQ